MKDIHTVLTVERNRNSLLLYLKTKLAKRVHYIRIFSIIGTYYWKTKCPVTWCSQGVNCIYNKSKLVDIKMKITHRTN